MLLLCVPAKDKQDHTVMIVCVIFGVVVVAALTAVVIALICKKPKKTASPSPSLTLLHGQ